jgi:hypothetical protein
MVDMVDSKLPLSLIAQVAHQKSFVKEQAN